MMTPTNAHRNGQTKEFRCFFGLLHVRTATFFIGVWHLMLNILAIGLLAVIIRNPDMMENYSDETLPTPLSNTDPVTPATPPETYYRDHSLNYQNIDMGGIVCLFMIGICLCMIYGVIKGKPSNLLPFFFLQLFDFAVTTLTAAGYLCYLRTLHRLIAESPRLPWREEIIKLDPRTLSVLVLFAFIGMVLLKAYSIGIVWRCYKYLTIRHNARSMLPYIIPDSSLQQERVYNSLLQLPDYDEAVQAMKQAPPPSYAVAMQQQTVALPNGFTAQPLASTSSSQSDSIPPPDYQSIVADNTETEPNTTTESNASSPVRQASESNSQNDISSSTNNQISTTNSVNSINN